MEKIVRNEFGEIAKVYGFTVTEDRYSISGYFVDLTPDLCTAEIYKDSEFLCSIKVPVEQDTLKIDWEKLFLAVKAEIPKAEEIFMEDILIDFCFLGKYLRCLPAGRRPYPPNIHTALSAAPWTQKFQRPFAHKNSALRYFL